MIREIVKIDEDLCNGCGVCIPNCHEGALQIIDNKARLISDLLCDGLGACIGHCPEGAISIEKREAESYDEVKVMKDMVNKGMNTVIAHLKHLKDHQEIEYLNQGIQFLQDHNQVAEFDVNEAIKQVLGNVSTDNHTKSGHSCGCPGSATRTFGESKASQQTNAAPTISDQPSTLTHWPVQMHLINPAASHFSNSDLILAADCVAFSLGSFHQSFLKGKTLAIACPKLDQGAEIYIQKLVSLIDDAKVNTITVIRMEVPCCGGLLQFVQIAQQNAQRRIPVKTIVISVDGRVLQEEWV